MFEGVCFVLENIYLIFDQVRLLTDKNSNLDQDTDFNWINHLSKIQLKCNLFKIRILKKLNRIKDDNLYNFVNI